MIDESELLQFFSDSFKSGVITISQLTTILYTIFKAMNEDRVKAGMLDYISNGGMIAPLPINNIDLENLRNKLDKMDPPIDYYQIQNSGSKNKTYLLFKDADVDIVQEKLLECKLERQRAEIEQCENDAKVVRLSPSEFGKFYNDESVISSKGLESFQITNLEDEARKNNFVFTAVKGDDNLYTAYFLASEQQNVNNALTSVALYSAGDLGKSKKGIHNANTHTIEEIDNKASKVPCDFYVFDADTPVGHSNYAHIVDNEFRYKNGNSVKVFKNGKGDFKLSRDGEENKNNSVEYKNVDDSTYSSELYTALFNMKQPIIMSVEEFNKCKSNEEVSILLSEKEAKFEMSEQVINVEERAYEAFSDIFEKVNKNEADVDLPKEINNTIAIFSEKEQSIVQNYIKEMTEIKKNINTTEAKLFNDTELKDYYDIGKTDKENSDRENDFSNREVEDVLE